MLETCRGLVKPKLPFPQICELKEPAEPPLLSQPHVPAFASTVGNRTGLIIAVLSAVMLAAASYVPATNLSAPDQKYGVVDMSWAVELIPGNSSSTTILNGTVEEVYQQLNATSPDYMDLLEKYWASNPATPSQDAMRNIGSMDDRRDCGYCNVCTKRWPPAGLGSVLDAIRLLRMLKGRPNLPPGQGNCGRFACIGSSQAWMCNDSAEDINLDSWSVIADAVEDITRQCWWREKEGLHLYDVTGGQIFRPDGWNVVVRGDASC